MVTRALTAILSALAACALCACVTQGAEPSPGWMIESQATPTHFSNSRNTQCETTLTDVLPICDAYTLTAKQVGSVPSGESAVTLTDTLPAGLQVQKVQLFWSGITRLLGLPAETNLAELASCTTSSPVQCSLPSFFTVDPGDTIRMVVNVTVEDDTTRTLTNVGTVAGGGGLEASTREQNEVSPTAPAFGANAFANYLAGVDGAPDTQAGAHPYELTTALDLNNEFSGHYVAGTELTSVQDVKDIVLDMPLGLVGSALSAPTCTLAQLTSPDGCPSDTQVGNIITYPQVANNSGGVKSAIYHVVSEHGYAAEYGYIDGLHGTHVLYANVAWTPAGYVLRVTSLDVPQIDLATILVGFYGDPGERDGSGGAAPPTFTNPSACTGEPLTSTVYLDSWQHPGAFDADGSPDLSDPNWVSASYSAPPMTGCNLLQFFPSVSVTPETGQASAPTGLTFDVSVPQSEAFAALATPPLRDAVVSLPAGLAVNPAAANGLQACSLAQIGLGSNSQPSCPEASKIASVQVTTPAVPGVLQGSIYLARQGENPFGSLLAGYIVVDDPATGVLLKVPGEIAANSATGQLTASFRESPQFPFSDLKIHFFGGPRATLTTPPECGTYTASAALTPWSSETPVQATSSFGVSTGCTQAFAPGFVGGTTNNQAGGFSPLSVSLSRQDGEQGLSGVSVTTPPGLLGVLKSVAQCPEPQAAQGTCGAGSLIGHATAAVGVGPDPVDVTGQVFLTGPYKSAPFGLSVVIPAAAGPFNLGTVVVRAAIHVDPRTAQITVSSDAFPTMLQGIPLPIKAVNITIDREGFLFNPTSCEPLSLTGSLSSTQGASVPVASRFQAANCQSLPFHPSFTVSTQAKTSKQNGASLDVKYTSGAGQANTAKVAVSLPKALPSRLTTIQQACPEAVFAANPASCPAGSDIGTGTASTPILAKPVSGPAYLVSHGGAAFPDLVVILQGEGVTVELIGSIDIKGGVTSSTFATVPDAPIDTFQLLLPEGPHSALTAVLPAKAKGSLCGQSLVMPTAITGQNGAQITQQTKIKVTGCTASAVKKKTKPKKHKHGKHAKKRGKGAAVQRGR